MHMFLIVLIFIVVLSSVYGNLRSDISTDSRFLSEVINNYTYVTTYYYSNSNCDGNYISAVTVELRVCFQEKSDPTKYYRYVTSTDSDFNGYYIEYFIDSAPCTEIPYSTSSQYNYDMCPGSGDVSGTKILPSSIQPSFAYPGSIQAGYVDPGCLAGPAILYWQSNTACFINGENYQTATCSDGVITYEAYSNDACQDSTTGSYSVGPYSCSTGAVIPGFNSSASSYVTNYCASVVTLVPTFLPTQFPSAPTVTKRRVECFAGSDSVLIKSGQQKLLSDVEIGDVVLTSNNNGILSYSPVIALPHKRNYYETDFIQIYTEMGRDIKLTSNHLLPYGSCNMAGKLSLGYAKYAKKGECVITIDGVKKITDIKVIRSEGLYTVVTQNEYIVVNGIIASPFSHNHVVAHSFYNIFRFLYSITPVVFQPSFSFTGPILENFESFVLL